MQTLTTLLQEVPYYQKSLAIFFLYMSIFGVCGMVAVVIDGIRKHSIIKNDTIIEEEKQNCLNCGYKPLVEEAFQFGCDCPVMCIAGEEWIKKESINKDLKCTHN